jgi:hypothetical protein
MAVAHGYRGGPPWQLIPGPQARREAPDRRLANLRAALGFLSLAPAEPGLRLLHRWLDTWEGVAAWLRRAPGDMATACRRAAGDGVAPTPWAAVQMAARGREGGGVNGG